MTANMMFVFCVNLKSFTANQAKLAKVMNLIYFLGDLYSQSQHHNHLMILIPESEKFFELQV